MSEKIFRYTFLLFLVVMALVVGGACYQTISIVPLWERDISLFENYRDWGIDYFPVLSPLMTVLWLILVVTGFKVRFSNKAVFYTGHFFFLLVMVSTFIYFAPFLLEYMGKADPGMSDEVLGAKISHWAKLDRIRQAVGLIPLVIYYYSYGKFMASGARS